MSLAVCDFSIMSGTFVAAINNPGTNSWSELWIGDISYSGRGGELWQRVELP